VRSGELLPTHAAEEIIALMGLGTDL